MDGRMFIPLLVAISLASCVSFGTVSPGPASKPSTFQAAVYEHVPFLPTVVQTKTRENALQLMNKNLEVYRIQTRKAKQQGAQIIVFPEDGIYGMFFNRNSILHFLEKIPDPTSISWSPCSDPMRFSGTEVQHALSCIAQENSLYVVANIGDFVPCNTTVDPKCPADDHYQYNTDVAFDPDGKLVAKYHKSHLFYEFQFDTPNPEVVYFDTPFGRFGMLTCFDLLFKDPAVVMVTDNNITNIAFPTAWMDALPSLSAIGYHSSFARGLGVNFLAANVHLPKRGFHGSGVYTPDGMSSFYYNNHLLSPGKLLVSTVNIVQRKENGVGKDNLKVKSLAREVNSVRAEFQAELFGDLYTFRSLDDSSGSLNVCQRNVCCSLTYNISGQLQYERDLFALGVFDGLHTLEGHYYFQVCTLVKCGDRNNKSSCGSGTKISYTKFKTLSLTGHFQTKFVYPQIVLAKDKQLLLADQSSWSFQKNTLKAESGLNEPLLSVTLLGRYYCRDRNIQMNAVMKQRPVLLIKE